MQISITDIVKKFLQTQKLDKDDITYIVAFSGGFDSMCMLHALKKIAPKNKIVAIHLNHKWRGDESDLEEVKCKEFCQKIGVEFYCESLSSDIAHTETAARNARYNFFSKCAKKFKSQIVFTAHNKNDNAETLIYRICQGTGINGLQGIASERDIFYRPLLKISRTQIEKYCKDNKLNPNIDSSNSNTKYKRNFIRSNVLPQLLKINPNTIENISSLAEIAAEETEIIEEYTKFIIKKITKNGEIQTKEFIKLSKPLQKKLIYKLFLENKLDYDRKKIYQIYEFIKENSCSKSGKICSLTNNLWLFTSEKIIKTISKNKLISPYLHITKEGKFENEDYIFEIEKFNKPVKKFPNDSENIAYVDLSKLEFNFELRTRKDGDIIKPLGCTGHQKLKKYLNSKNIPNHEKDNLIFLAQDNEILWAIGLGISDKIKVCKTPTHVIKYKM